MLKRIKFTSVPVQDQSRALEFYTKKLGLKVFTDQTMGDERWIELKANGAETMLVLFKQPKDIPSPPAVVFVTDNVQATYEELKAKGVEFVQPPKKEHWGEHAIRRTVKGTWYWSVQRKTGGRTGRLQSVAKWALGFWPLALGCFPGPSSAPEVKNQEPIAKS